MDDGVCRFCDGRTRQGDCEDPTCPESPAHESCVPSESHRKVTQKPSDGFLCPVCGKGRMRTGLGASERQLGGKPVHVEDAKIETCDHCGETSVSAVELKRWEGLQREQELARRVKVLEEQMKESLIREREDGVAYHSLEVRVFNLEQTVVKLQGLLDA